MGLCSGAWNKLSAILPSPFAKAESRMVKAVAKCPDCGREFEIEIKVDQQVAGSVSNFTASGGSGISAMCPWAK